MLVAIMILAAIAYILVLGHKLYKNNLKSDKPIIAQEIIVKNTKKKILVIEDRQNHITDAKAMFNEVLADLPTEFEVIYAQDFTSAMNIIGSADYVMTDVFFPTKAGGAEEPNGQKIVEHCLKTSKPVVWITSTYHHGNKTEKLWQWGRERGVCLFDCSVGTCHDNLEAEHKPWKAAFLGLISIVVGLEMKVCSFEDDPDCVSEKILMQPSGENDPNKPGPLMGTDSIPYFLAQPVSRNPLIVKMKELGYKA